MKPIAYAHGTKTVAPTGCLHITTYQDGTFRLSAEGDCRRLLDGLTVASQHAVELLAAQLGATMCPAHASPSTKTRTRAK